MNVRYVPLKELLDGPTIRTRVTKPWCATCDKPVDAYNREFSDSGIVTHYVTCHGKDAHHEVPIKELVLPCHMEFFQPEEAASERTVA